MTKFPTYRKTVNEKSFYKISSPSSVLEIQRIGSHFLAHQLDAKILPERNHIADLIENANKIWLNIEASEFEEINQLYIKNK